MTGAGVLLTGGTSRRMGTDKAEIVWRGETLAVRAARVLAAVCDRVVEVGPGVSGLDAVREDPVGAGPLAALVAGAAALGVRQPVVLLACDLPFVEPPLLQLLLDWPGRETVIPLVGGHLQYTCARYGSDALERARAALRAGDRSLRLAADVDHDEIAEEAWQAVARPDALADVDTPEDLHRLGLS